ncbi:MAG: dehydrogenase, partial [Actinomycetia bacterium]|nr:dehydrogenase [Actinomycetes bacterium]
REAEARALEQAPRIAAEAAEAPERGGFAEHLDEVPVLLILLADLRALAAVDRDFDRYTLVGGAYIYPFAWSVLLAAHDEGLGGVMTSMLTREEEAARALLNIPPEFAVAGAIVLGHPVRQPTRLRRQSVEEFTTVDRFDGPAFTAGSQPGG